MRLNLLDDAALQAYSPERLIALIARVRQVIEAATVYQRHLITMAEQCKAVSAVSDISTADSLVCVTGMSRRWAWSVQRQARAIVKRPEVAAALVAGTLSAEQAEMITRAEVSCDTGNRLLEAAAAGESADGTRLRVACRAGR